MKIVKNSLIPFKGFTALTIWPFVFVRNDEKTTPVIMHHEEIHGQQQKELLFVFFYLWYGIEYVLRLAKYRNRITAYKNISFEREAYSNQNNIVYLDERKPYAFVKYIKM